MGKSAGATSREWMPKKKRGQSERIPKAGFQQGGRKDLDKPAQQNTHSCHIAHS
jgi:hypothetical protein